MKTARALLALPGLAALAWGVVLFAEYALPVRPDVIATAAWIVGGPVFNDGVIAPLTAVLGIVLSRIVPRPWKAPVVAGTVITGVLAIVAFPLLWRPYGTPPMPGLHDGDPALGLALTVAAVWLAVIVTALTIRARRPTSAVTPAAAPTEHSSPSPAPHTAPAAPTEHSGAPADPTGTPHRTPAQPTTETPGTPVAEAPPNTPPGHPRT
ncbi:hypothetical protein [Amycolatopsis solani]|uniref:hypothetical protein n=1 Tax=Amycolatopsis solani TaxID=3028615 RepID=UPI0025B19A7D|nr:hypothetical protein [Amycolatopsis sp. MEP2-6]